MKTPAPNPAHNPKRLTAVKRNGLIVGYVTKIKGQTKWVSSGANYDQAYAAYIAKFGADRPATVKPGRMTMGQLANRYLGSKLVDRDAGRINAGYYAHAGKAIAKAVKVIGRARLVSTLTPDDFTDIAAAFAHLAPNSQRRDAAIIGAMFKRAADDKWITAPLAMGQAFKKMRRVPRRQTERPVYSAYHCFLILLAGANRAENRRRGRVSDADTGVQAYAQLLLALNGGFSQRELGQLRRHDVDLPGAIVRTIREKTEIRRVVPLWPETVEALRIVMTARPDDSLVFRTKRGHALVREVITGPAKITTHDAVQQSFRKLAESLGLKRPGYGFRLLRPTFRTIAGASGRESAADIIMGHRLPGMREVYRRVSEDELREVVDYVRHQILFQAPNAASKSGS